MKKNIVLAILLGVIFIPSLAIGTETSNASDLVQKLQQQIEQLKSQITALNTQLTAVKQTQGEVKETLKLIRQLKPGMSGEDVKLLQQVLATDPDIYPEGKITGYFGKMTENAVKLFQKAANLNQVGNVGPKTLDKINELLKGAGNSGKVPPGLLIAPGIRKKLNIDILKPLPGQILPPGISKKLNGQTKDTVPPIISNISASSINPTSFKVNWTTNELSDSTVWYDTVSPLLVTASTSNAKSSDYALSHEITLSGLLSGTPYYYIVSSTDKAGNNEISAQSLFTTVSQ